LYSTADTATGFISRRQATHSLPESSIPHRVKLLETSSKVGLLGFLALTIFSLLKN
jgi:hypothetical protein